MTTHCHQTCPAANVKSSFGRRNTDLQKDSVSEKDYMKVKYNILFF